MTDSTTTDEAPDEGAGDDLPWWETLWRDSWSALLKAVFLSALLHFLLSIPVWLHPSLPGDFDVDWEGRMGELSAIGHGVEDFDETEEVDWDAMEDYSLRHEEEEEDEEEHEEDDEEEHEEDDEEEQADEEDEEPNEETEPEPRDGPEEEESPEPVDELAVEAEETDDPEPETEPAEEVDDTVDELPVADRSGPSNLPDMRDYGPGNARVTSLVRLDRIRDTELEPYVDELLRAVPDYRIALEGTEFRPVEELDSLFMATANPERLDETFLAARHHHESQEMRRILDARFAAEMHWETEGERPMRRLVPESATYDDPRRLLLADDGLALIGRPEWFEELIEPVSDDSRLGRELADQREEEGADGGSPSAFRLLDGLARIEEIAEREETLLLVSAYGVRLRSMPGLDLSDLPSFQSMRLAISDPEAPSLEIDLRFRSESDAREFADRCPSLQRNLRGLLRWVGLADLVAPLDCERREDYVVVTGEYTGEQTRQLLDRIAPLVEAIQPPALAGVPDPPQPAPESEEEIDEEVDTGDAADDESSPDPDDIPPQ